MKGVLALAAAVAALLAAAPAQAATVTCKPGKYLVTAEGVTHLRATGLPVRTGGYAPRCLVAESVAAEVQIRRRASKATPKRVNVFGARWSAGKWTVKRSGRRVTATQGAKTVTFDI